LGPTSARRRASTVSSFSADGCTPPAPPDHAGTTKARRRHGRARERRRRRPGVDRPTQLSQGKGRCSLGRSQASPCAVEGSAQKRRRRGSGAPPRLWPAVGPPCGRGSKAGPRLSGAPGGVGVRYGWVAITERLVMTGPGLEPPLPEPEISRCLRHPWQANGPFGAYRRC
jgi:hypothetical protein